MAIEKPVETAVLERYLDRVKSEKGLDPSNLAKRAGLSPATLTRLKQGQRHARRSTLEALERASGIPLPEELRAAAEMPAGAPETGLIRVYALVGTPLKSAFYLNPIEADRIAAPPALAHASSVYAVRMPDDSMMPWRRPHELIFVDRTLDAAPGDHALVETNHPHDPNHAHPLYRVRRYLGPSRNGYRLASHRSEAEEIIPAPEFVRAARILEWPEVFGFR